MSMIFQSYALWPHMTVAENIVYGLKLRKLDRATIGKKLDAILATTKLAPLAQRYPGELSGGQQQRVALARALIVEPETLLLDEPLSNLDANLREEMRFEVRRLHDAYRYTTVYVTHDQSEAMTTADLIAVMNAGKIEQAGSPEEIYDRPRSEFVARFIGVEQRHQGQGARRRARRVCRRAAALRRRAKLQPAPRPRCRSARTTSRSRPRSRAGRKRRAGDGGAAGLSRRQPGLYGRGQGRHAIARRHAAGENIPQGSAVWLHLPPERCRALSGVEENCGARRQDQAMEDTPMKDSRTVPPRCADRVERARRGAAFSTKVLAAAPPASAITPALIEAAKKEGKVVWYTSVDLPLAEKIAKAFEAKFPGIAVRVERTGAERVFQRIGQEYGSNIHAVDVANSSDAAHFIVWKHNGMLEAYLPEDVAKFYPAEHKDPDGMFASFRVWVCIIAYNTNLVKKEDAPKSFADLLDPKWKGKIVKAHPGYSGTIMTATYQMQRDLGWGFFEKLAEQNIMQVQSSADPPKRLALGERAVMADGNEYNIFQIKEKGGPVAAGLCHRRLAADRRADRHVQGGAESERREAVLQPTASRRSASSSSSTSAACARCIRRPRKKPAARRSRTSRS